jgi:hypothetical protein
MLDAAFWSQNDTSLDEHLDAPEPSYAPSMTLVHFVGERVYLRRMRRGEMLDEKVTQSKCVLRDGTQTQQGPDP